MPKDSLPLILKSYYWAVSDLLDTLNGISKGVPEIHLILARNRLELIKKNSELLLKTLGVKLEKPSDEELKRLVGSFAMEFMEGVRELKRDGSLTSCLSKSLEVLPLAIGFLRAELMELPESSEELNLIVDSLIRDTELILERNRSVLESLKRG